MVEISIESVFRIGLVASAITEFIKRYLRLPRIATQILSLFVCFYIVSGAVIFGVFGEQPDYQQAALLVFTSWLSSMGLYETAASVFSSKYKR